MAPNFDVKYLSINWYDKETIVKITESMVSLDLFYNEESDIFYTETTIYPKLGNIKNGMLAFKLLDDSDSQPYIKMPNGKILYLESIVDPETKNIWWIVKSSWDDEYKKWTSILTNTVGNLDFVIQGQSLQIKVNGSDFNLEQLEQYLSSFKNDLWELILDDSSPSYVKSENNGIAVNEKVIECISSLISHAEHILANPKVELREIQALKSRKQVKPVNRTFMELVTKTNYKLLTSRTTKGSFNTAENRYVLFGLERCYRIIRQILLLTQNKCQYFNRMKYILGNRYSNLTDYVIVNRDLVVSDLEKLREKSYLTYWQKELDNSFKKYISPNEKSKCYITFKLEGKTKNEDGFFVKIFNVQSNSFEMPKSRQGGYKKGILSIKNSLDLSKVLEKDMILECHYYDIPLEDEYDKVIVFNFVNLSYVRLLDCHKVKKYKSAFLKEKALGLELSKNGWEKPLSKQEREENERERKTIKNRIIFYKENYNFYNHFLNKIEPKLKKISSLIRKFKSLKIKSSSYFPNSMTFVQNPHYQSVHNNYKILRNLTNLQDDHILLILDEIDNIGLVNMPLLYERWVLVQILSTLKNIFRFTLQKDWKYKLVNAIKNNHKNIEIELSNEDAKRYITLTYERELSNGKRPDFTLDLKWFKRDGDTTPQFKRFILDAKFYNKEVFQKAGGMLSKIDELYTDKNYSENGENPVFLIHPCKNLIDKPVTAQSWGKYSFLGELDLSGKRDYPCHNKGAIFLSPIDNLLYRDELQRLLGMFLQYKLENNETLSQYSDMTNAYPICIQCGSTHLSSKEKSSEYYNTKLGQQIKRTSRSAWLKCEECNLWQVHNHCFEDDIRLIKNGLYWSYHSVRAIEPFNVKCPHCGEWGIW